MFCNVAVICTHMQQYNMLHLDISMTDLRIYVAGARISVCLCASLNMAVTATLCSSIFYCIFSIFYCIFSLFYCIFSISYCIHLYFTDSSALLYLSFCDFQCKTTWSLAREETTLRRGRQNWMTPDM